MAARRPLGARLARLGVLVLSGAGVVFWLAWFAVGAVSWVSARSEAGLLVVDAMVAGGVALAWAGFVLSFKRPVPVVPAEPSCGGDGQHCVESEPVCAADFVHRDHSAGCCFCGEPVGSFEVAF